MNGTTTADKTEKVGITLAITLVNQVDKVRGDIPRSTYIRRAVERYIQGKDATPASLSWFILTPVQATKNLINLLKSMHLNISTQNALISRLNAALQFLSHGPKFNVGACGEFNGFIRQVQGAARENALTPTQALQLINSAQAIQKALGC